MAELEKDIASCEAIETAAAQKERAADAAFQAAKKTRDENKDRDKTNALEIAMERAASAWKSAN